MQVHVSKPVCTIEPLAAYLIVNQAMVTLHQIFSGPFSWQLQCRLDATYVCNNFVDTLVKESLYKEVRRQRMKTGSFRVALFQDCSKLVPSLLQRIYLSVGDGNDLRPVRYLEFFSRLTDNAPVQR